MIFSIPVLGSGAMQVMFINECKSCEISNQMFFNQMSTTNRQTSTTSRQTDNRSGQTSTTTGQTSTTSG